MHAHCSIHWGKWGGYEKSRGKYKKKCLKSQEKSKKFQISEKIFNDLHLFPSYLPLVKSGKGNKNDKKHERKGELRMIP